MLLKSIKVKDFRQFKGEQYVSFSTDPERNVTIIQGDNGAGKTSLHKPSVGVYMAKLTFLTRLYYQWLFQIKCCQEMKRCSG